MARKEDISLEKQLADARAEYNRRVENGLSYQKKQLAEVERLEAKITERNESRLKAIDSSVKSAKIYAKLTSVVEKSEASLDKSISSRIANLVKGNLAGAIQLKSTKQHSNLQNKLNTDARDNAHIILQSGKTNEKQKLSLLQINEEIKSGLLEEEHISDRINSIEDLGTNVKKKAIEAGTKLFKTQESTALAGAKSAADMSKFSKLSAKAAGTFAVLYAIAQKFATQQDAIGSQFGSLNSLSGEFKNNLITSAEEVTGLGATIQDVNAVTTALSSNFGIGANEASNLSAKVIDTAKALGVSNEEAANLFGTLMATSGLSAQQAERLAEGARQLAVANNVVPDAVLKDMAGSAEAFAVFSEDGGDNLAKAAVQARALGLSLDTTAKIAEGLLDFETSIGKELEASVLIGRQLNFQKARELTLNNDIEGAISNIVSQLGSEAEFNRLNSIQRKAIADSIGVSVVDMAKMVANQDKANKLAGETAKSFTDIIGKDAMSELTAATNELKILGVALANTLGPILMLLAKTVNLILVPLGNIVSGLSSSIRSGFENATTVNDGIFKPGGITHMMGPSGVFSLNPRDSVMATTNRINDGQGGVGGFSTFPQGALGGGGGTLTNEVTLRNNDLLFVTNYMGSNFANGARLGTNENSTG